VKALVKFGATPGAVEIREIPEQQVLSGMVLVQPVAVGVCGSDVHMWQENQSWPVKDDLVLGHEAAGRIVEVGEGVPGWSAGDRVTWETAFSVCGICALCRRGNYNMCPHRQGFGALRDGCFTERVAVPPRILHRVPDSVSFAEAAMTEPYCVGYNALVERGTIVPGDLVVVQGLGAIGMVSIEIARLSGAGIIVAIGTAKNRPNMELAKQLGADHVVDLSVDKPMDVIGPLGDGFGADVVVDATGVSEALRSGMEFVRPMGTIVKVGWGPEPLNFSLDPLVAKAATIVGSFSHTWNTWERVLSLFAANRLRPRRVIGGEYSLEDWEAAFSDMESGRNAKSVVTLSVERGT